MTRYINIHTHVFSNQPNVLEVVNQYPCEFNNNIPTYSVGIHPWHINSEKIDDELALIENIIKNNACLAIGECGLDKRITIDFDMQVTVFKQQLLLAQLYNMPVIVHCVAAFQELIAIKKELKINVPMIVHGFSKNEKIANQLINNGFYISFGKYLLRNPELQDVFASVPNNKIFLETDTIQENIADVYQLAAKYKNMNIEELQNKIQDNFNLIFNKNIVS